MYNTNSSEFPKRPAQVSASAANAAFMDWVAVNDFKHIKDKAGMVWNVEFILEEVPAAGSARQLEVRLNLHLRGQLVAAELVRTGVLDADTDERLLGLIPERGFPVTMQPIMLVASSQEEMRQELGKKMVELREQMRREDLKTIKRGLVGRWIDEHSWLEYRKK